MGVTFFIQKPQISTRFKKKKKKINFIKKKMDSPNHQTVLNPPTLFDLEATGYNFNDMNEQALSALSACGLGDEEEYNFQNFNNKNSQNNNTTVKGLLMGQQSLKQPQKEAAKTLNPKELQQQEPKPVVGGRKRSRKEEDCEDSTSRIKKIKMENKKSESILKGSTAAAAAATARIFGEIEGEEKNKHRQAEKSRRNYMTQKINELKGLLPNLQGRGSKLTVISEAISHIQKLEMMLYMLTTNDGGQPNQEAVRFAQQHLKSKKFDPSQLSTAMFFP